MKHCKYCGLDKPYDLTAKVGSKASGFVKGGHCWDCVCARSWAFNKAKWATPEGKVKTQASSAAWRKSHPSKACELSRNRDARKLQRVPAWADCQKIAEFYREARKLGLVVDHIIPLRGELVSGLHVHTNLQLLTHAENSSKRNKFEVA